jgi:hypothetical protein
MNLNNDAVTELPLNVQAGCNPSPFMFAYVPGIEGSDHDYLGGSVAKTQGDDRGYFSGVQDWGANL